MLRYHHLGIPTSRSSSNRYLMSPLKSTTLRQPWKAERS